MENISPFKKIILLLATASNLFFTYATRFIFSRDFRQSLSTEAKNECTAMLTVIALALGATLLFEASALQAYLDGGSVARWLPYLAIATIIDMIAFAIAMWFVRNVEGDMMDGLWDSPATE